MRRWHVGSRHQLLPCAGGCIKRACECPQLLPCATRCMGHKCRFCAPGLGLMDARLEQGEVAPAAERLAEVMPRARCYMPLLGSAV